jgi:hypothetical protein
MTAALRYEFYSPLVFLGRQISNSGSCRLAVTASFGTVSVQVLVTAHSTGKGPNLRKEGI